MASLSMNRLHNQIVLASLEPGDLVEFPRGVFSHWAVYIGHGKVIHVAGNKYDGVYMSRARVMINWFWDVVDTGKARKNNRLDVYHQPLSKAKIVDNALARIGRWVRYDVLFDNCEHFANWCRYGLNISEQAFNFRFLLVPFVL